MFSELFKPTQCMNVVELSADQLKPMSAKDYDHELEVFKLKAKPTVERINEVLAKVK